MQVPSSHTDCAASLVLDGANGVGANKMKVINDLLSDNLDISVCNDGAGTLNHQVKQLKLYMINLFVLKAHMTVFHQCIGQYPDRA